MLITKREKKLKMQSLEVATVEILEGDERRTSASLQQDLVSFDVKYLNR